MAPTQQELSLLIDPMVAECISHNNKLLSNIRSLASFLLGFSAGILGLQSITGFAFYFIGAMLVSFIFHTILVSVYGGEQYKMLGAGAFFPGDGELRRSMDGKPLGRAGAWKDVWFGGIGQAASGFVLGWAGVGGLLR
ncbi:hypothetical protein KEM54_005920 [Ascosphaera aggregata]|nr:hypothetical protein KEM54_005920 [Ascosphaera aggregata]